MAGVKVPSRALVTPELRFSFIKMVHPEPYKENGVPKGTPMYQLQGLIPEASLTQFRVYDEATNKYVFVNIVNVLAELAQEAWPGKNVKELFEHQLDNDGKPGKGWPLKRGDVKAEVLVGKGKKADYLTGMRIMAMKSYQDDKIAPPQMSMVTGKNTFKTLDRASESDMAQAVNLFRSGNWGFATINLRAKFTAGTYAITPYINGIRYTRSDDPIGGSSEMDRFDGVTGGASDHDPTQGMDDEIPF